MKKTLTDLVPMNIPRILSAIVLALLMTSTGDLAQARRRLAPIINHDNVAVARTDDKPMTADKVRQIITGAVTAKGWTVKPVKDDLLQATLDKPGKYKATVDIAYSDARYSIKYHDSSSLNYEKKYDGQEFIHPNYNKWVADLVQSINDELRKGN